MVRCVRHLLLMLLFSHPVVSLGQCQPTWLPGEGMPGLSGNAIALAEFDPDGIGPQPAQFIVGGTFKIAGSEVVNYIAAWDTSKETWQSLNGGMNGFVFAMDTLPEEDLVAGGDFGIAGGVPVAYIAKWDGESWAPLGTEMNGVVWAIEVLSNGQIVAGGSFNTAGGITASAIARWDGIAWSPIGSGIVGKVYALAELPNGDIVAGGSFTKAGGVSVSHIARWDGVTWSAMGSGMYIPSGPSVNALAVLASGDLIAGGKFVSAGGVSVNHIARWDGSTWNGIGGGMQDQVRSLLVRSGGSIVAGGALLRREASRPTM